MGVLLMCAIQELCVTTETSLDLFLQTCYENTSFMWFITLGICYASQHYGQIVDLDDVPMTDFPICSDPKKVLPKHLASLAKKGEVTYTGTFDDTPDEEKLMMRLLCLKKCLCEWFPPNVAYYKSFYGDQMVVFSAISTPSKHIMDSKN